MWQQYKKTFVGMQLVIAVITAGVAFWSHVWSLAALFFLTMQVNSVFGAIWASRLKGKFEQSAGGGSPRRV